MGAAPPAQIFFVTGCLNTLMQVFVELMESMAQGTTLRLGSPGLLHPHLQSHSAQPEPE